MKQKQRVILEGVDYYIDEQGLMVLTSKYLKKRGYCCHNGCRHCPYESKVKGQNLKIRPKSTFFCEAAQRKSQKF